MPELMHNKNFKKGGGHDGQKFVILMVKIKEFLSWDGGTCPQSPPPAYECFNYILIPGLTLKA